MKKWQSIVLTLIFASTALGSITIKPLFTQSAQKGRWVYSEKKLIDEPVKRPPFSTEIAGEEGKKVLTAKFENQNVKEIAIIEMGWTIPPKQLIPGEDFEFIQTGLIKEWNTTHFFSSSMYARIQRFGASCCEIAGPDLGFIRMDYENGDPIGIKKEVKKVVKIPEFGDLDSKDSQKIQILVKLQQNGAQFQWIYIYEWKEIAETKRIEIQLKIGSKNALVNDTYRTLDSPPFVEKGRTYVPFRFLGEAFGANVSYTSNPVTKLVDSVQYSLNDINILLFINKNEAFVNQKKIILDAPPVLRNGRVMAPLRFVSENLSAAVTWNPILQSITIIKE